MLIPRGSAILSDCGTFRFWLERDLGGIRPLVSIGANPSIADHENDDQTMRKEQGFARFWGCGLLIKVNMNAYRATKPKDMWAAAARGDDIVGVDVKGLHNDYYIMRAIQLAIDHDGIVLGAWGAITKPQRVADVLLKIQDRFADWYPYHCLDLKQYAYHLGLHDSLKTYVPQVAGEHNALQDAHWNRRAHLWLMEFDAKRRGYV